MRKLITVAAFILALLAGGFGGIANAIDQAMPGDHAADAHSQMNPSLPPMADASELFTGDRSAFEKQVQLDEFRLLAVQHLDQMKIIDSWARQCLLKIRNSQTIDGKDPVIIALDIGLRPEVWNDRNIVYIQAIPIREQLTQLVHEDTPEATRREADRIVHEGLVSMRFLERADVQRLLGQIALDTRHAQSVGRIFTAMDTLSSLFFRLNIAPPGAGNRDGQWHQPIELVSNTLSDEERKAQGNLPIVAGYTAEQSLKIRLAITEVMVGWRTGDVVVTNQGLKILSATLPAIDPAGYPSRAKRVTELWYNRTFYGTVANVFLYFAAMTLFLLFAVGVNANRRYAYSIFTVAVVLHLVSMGIRMWLAGRWPTQNQFESVLGAALLGCVVGWLLETWKKNGLFGMAFSFVGFLAMTACMAAPYMFGNDLGGAISKTAGILQTYWLYIHVNIVISSYALIAASFLIGAVYLGMKLWFWINPIEVGFDGVEPAMTDTDRLVATVISPMVMGAAVIATGKPMKQITESRTMFLETLDQANMVILQMGMWFLGIGIICGAVWADHSWGRPWGWDPKETFALVTWIVYLIIVHVRLVVPKARADATAAMSIAGFVIMMFNWIGVNYFLAGLHSYA